MLKLRRARRYRVLFAIAALFVPLLACQCTVQASCRNSDGTLDQACVEYVNVRCADPGFFPTTYHTECVRAIAGEYRDGSPINAAPNPPQQQAIVAPSCAIFNLTSPLDGLRNGATSFYWDALPSATSYRINISEGGLVLASASVDAPTTTVTVDTSTGAIGGGYILTVEIQALINSSVSCSKTYTIPREAPAGDGGQSSNQSQPPASQSGPICGNNWCEPGEDVVTCYQDCQPR